MDLSFLSLNIYSLVLLMFVYGSARRQTDMNDARTEKTQQRKIFLALTAVTSALLVIDALSRLDGIRSTVFPVVVVMNFLLYALAPAISVLWFCYVCRQIMPNTAEVRPWLVVLTALGAAECLLVFLSQFFGWIYYFDAQCIYHRGPLFGLPAVLMIAMTMVPELFVVMNRGYIEKRYFFALIFFPVPPLICGLLQMLFYGEAFTLSGIAFSLLIVFVDIQNRDMDIDYLTGVYNRRRLDIRMKQEIRSSTGEKTFAAVLIDLDNFKQINDTQGHCAGDAALESAASLLKESMRVNDFVARYGGDEFCAIVDVKDQADLNAIIVRISENVQKFNEEGACPYQLGFSMGYAVYDAGSHMSVEQFQKKIDNLMYEDKRFHHLRQGTV